MENADILWNGVKTLKSRFIVFDDQMIPASKICEIENIALDHSKFTKGIMDDEWSFEMI